MRVSGALALIVITLLPSSAAAMAFEADLAFPAGLAMDGDARVRSAAGVLNLTSAILAGEGAQLRWESGSGYLVRRAYDYVGTREVETYQGEARPSNETLTLGRGSMLDFACDKDCRVIVFADGREGSALDAQTRVTGSPGWTREPWRLGVSAREPGIPDSFYHEIPAGALAFGPLGGGALGSVLLAPARVSVVLVGVQATIEDDAGRQDLDLRLRDEPRVLFGMPIGRRSEVPFALLHLEGAEVHLPAPTRASLLVLDPRVEMNGTLAAPEAHGEVRSGGRTRALEGEAFLVEGTMRGAWREARVGPLALVPTSPGGAGARLDGDARRLEIGGASVTTPFATPQEAAVGIGLLALVGGAILLLAKWLGVTPFYTRLERANILENPNRAAIYHAIREVPGGSPTQIARRLELSEVVVRHHLRMLETHSYVRLQARGRVRAYFLTNLAPPPDLRDAALALRDDTRQRILAELARAGPLSQKEIAERTTLSQRLVSYHLQRLREAHVVRPEGSMPRRYKADASQLERLAPMVWHAGQT